MEKTLSTIIIWAENKPGVFYRILWLFRRRMFNVESATAGHTEIEGVSRITITLRGDPGLVRNMCHQVNKLIHVIKVLHVDETDLIACELALVKIKFASKKEKADILHTLREFPYRIIHETHETLVIEVTGTEETIDALYTRAKLFTIVEFARTGRTALLR